MDPMQNFKFHRRSSSFETFVYFGLILGAYISNVAEIFLFSLVQVQIPSINPGFGPKLTLKLPSTPPPTTTTTQTFLQEGIVLGL